MTSLLWSIVAAAAVLVVAVVVGACRGKGVFGVLVDGRGKYSLSRLQVLLWTTLVLGGYFGIAFPQKSFVDIPAEVLGLLGISLGSSIVSATIKANQMLSGHTSSADRRRREAAEVAQNEMLSLLGLERPELLSPDEKAVLLEHLSEDECAELNRQIAARRAPSWMDLFSQEQRGTEHLVDIGKLQMFVWTLTALVIYGSSLGSVLTLPADDVRALTELPSVTGTILTLMGISQTAYLGIKLPNQSPAT
jgi:hypothetical protein